MTKSRLFSPLRALAGLALAGSLSSGVAAQSSEQEIFVDLGRWVILQDEARRICELRLSDGGPHVLSYQLQDGRAGSLTLQRRSGRYFSGMVGNVEWAFDDARFAGFSTGEGFALSAGSSGVERGFRAAKVLTVSQGSQPVARIDLKTSSAGFRLLEQCSEQWRYIPWYRRQANAQYRDLPDARNGRLIAGPSRPVPHSGARSAPNSSARSRPGGVAPALDPAEVGGATQSAPVAARPISPSSWIRADDRLPWPSRGFPSGQGVLRYTLLVDEVGRAQDCEVEGSTGSRKFDRRVCKLLVERARFDPARSSNGQAASARYTSTVRFADD
ncbi:TonB family protein [Qipengyuania sp. S6317L1]|uniref:TonB family protein n=1 Tax=Qipengyuania sp. S6317L1 TaxID=2926410 RepID=UPI001FF1ADCB|nr:TonB family protein [Qipengyuania sp. S6317L1]MCK0098689.1 TonB family protein [Qipengyuania sp. S6317L1]